MWRPGDDDRWLGARNLSCFRPEEDFGQTVSIAGIWVDIERSCHCSEPSVEASLNSSCSRGKPLSFRSPPTVRTATKTSSPMRRALACRARNQSRSRFKRNIIMEWRTASRARASLVRSAGLGWVSDSRPKLEWAMKNSERVARCRSVERNLSSRLVRREFSRYPCHSLNGAFLRFRIALKHDVAPRSR